MIVNELLLMDSDTKQSEVEVYDGDNASRPKYGSLWDQVHHDTLMDHGAEGDFHKLLNDYAMVGDVLVLGCGKGRLVRSLGERSPERSVYGIDISNKRLKTAKKISKDSSHIFRADAENLPFDTNSFNAVIAHSILHHLPALQSQGLDEISRVLTDNGTLLFYEPGKYNPPAFVRRRILPSRIHTPGEQPFDPSELRDILSSRFDSVNVTGHYILSNLMPVIDNYVPMNLSHSWTLKMYDLERTIMSHTGDKLAWVLTGIAKDPKA